MKKDKLYPKSPLAALGPVDNNQAAQVSPFLKDALGRPRRPLQYFVV